MWSDGFMVLPMRNCVEWFLSEIILFESRLACQEVLLMLCLCRKGASTPPQNLMLCLCHTGASTPTQTYAAQAARADARTIVTLTSWVMLCICLIQDVAI